MSNKKLAKNILSFEKIGNKYAIVKIISPVYEWEVLQKKKLTEDDPAMLCRVTGKKVLKDNAIYWKHLISCGNRQDCLKTINSISNKTQVKTNKNNNLDHLANKFKF